MPATKRPCQDALYLGLNIFRDTMRSYIVRRLQSVPGISVTSAISDSLGQEQAERFWNDLDERDDVEAAIDVNMFGQIIKRNWRQAFESEFDDSDEGISANLEEIRRIRNQIAHPDNGDIPKPRAEEALKAMARILSKFRAYDDADAIDKIREDMLAPLPSPPDPLPGLNPEEFAKLVCNQLAPVIKETWPNEEQLAEQTAQIVVNALRPDQSAPSKIVEIDAAVIERLERLTNPWEIVEQTVGKLSEKYRSKEKLQ